MSKLSLGGTASSGKLNSWVQPSFGGLIDNSGLSNCSLKKGQRRTGEGKGKGKGQAAGSESSSGKRPSKKRRADSEASEFRSLSQELLTSDHQDEPWVDKHRPCSQAELAVHKKKVEEVENWITFHLDSKNTSKQGATILLLTGPSGCGKTATVQVLAQELNYRVQEWTNPSTVSEFRNDDSFRETFDPHSRFNGFQGTSQTGAFQEFLVRANKYNRLQMSGDNMDTDRKVILVEDFPNQFYRNPGCLHDILRRFVKTGRCPLVFIVSDSLSGDRGSRLLFPREVQEELNITNVSFNPVAPTSLMKVLSRIATLEAGKSGGRISVPDKASLDLLCTGSSGDIRSAINSLQFSSLTDLSLEKSLWAAKKGKSVVAPPKKAAGSKAKVRSRSSRSTDAQEESQAIGGKDASLFLFRALGRILYCKREVFEPSEEPKLPEHLSEHRRDKLLVDPELVVERSHMSGEFFSLYLQQNYVDFFSDVDDVARASEYLSDADFLTAEWTHRSTMLGYGSSVATRGLIHSNSARARADCHTNVGFRPLHKPHWLLVNKKYRENCQAAQSLFISFCLTPVGLQTELVPYLNKLNNPLRNPAQIAFLQDVGHLPLRKFPGRLKLEALSDKDPGRLDDDTDTEDQPSDAPLAKESIDPASSGAGAEAEATPTPSCSQEAGADMPMSQPQPTNSETLLDEEDLNIEEYDSD
ncbi:cell cycle checkpoint protein RAD17 [Engraulis encrasicolus]|uniref:cell cycle checkpoint protein RAD17 n=1 Tax=Engraulis encrasicolus TaxID=184585 RepID=UPI002FD227BD